MTTAINHQLVTDEAYFQISHVVWDTITEFQKTGPAVNSVSANNQVVDIIVLADDEDPNGVKVRLYSQKADTYKTTYIDLVNPEDDTEETVGIVVGMLS